MVLADVLYFVLLELSPHVGHDLTIVRLSEKEEREFNMNTLRAERVDG